ncbi:hypothetical protein BC940DRAFT_322971 [Gongronella butleri]|nr:hypothetical protein BC940DRAFT_322971 [Gongronella butleri]
MSMQNICQKLIKDEFGVDAEVVVTKLMEKGHATADELVFSTGLARSNVDEALMTLFKHGLCTVATAAPELTDESPVSYSFDMNEALTRPSKTAVVMITRSEYGEKGAAIANAIFVKGRMTMTSLANEGLDTKDMAKNDRLSLVLTRSPSEAPESGVDWAKVNGEWINGTARFAINFDLFNMIFRNVAMSAFAGETIDQPRSHLILILMDHAEENEGMPVSKMKDEFQHLLESGDLGRFELHHLMTIKELASFVVERELKQLISQGFVIATMIQGNHSHLYRADLSQLDAKMKEHSLLAAARAACDDPTRQIAAVLLNGDAKSLNEIRELTYLPKSDIWSKLLAAEKMNFVKSDIPTQDCAFNPDDKRQWRIHVEPLQVAALESIYNTLARLNDPIPNRLDTVEARTILYIYGLSLFLRSI